MRKIILSCFILFFLTGCPNENEVNNMLEGLSEKKTQAVNSLQKKDYSLDGLLIMQDYFFDFSEKVHLLKIEPEAQKNLLYLIQENGLKSVCSSFVIPLDMWKVLNRFCTVGSYYRCSPEMKEYQNTLKIFKETIGPQLLQEPSCNL